MIKPMLCIFFCLFSLGVLAQAQKLYIKVPLSYWDNIQSKHLDYTLMHQGPELVILSIAESQYPLFVKAAGLENRCAGLEKVETQAELDQLLAGKKTQVQDLWSSTAGFEIKHESLIRPYLNSISEVEISQVIKNLTKFYTRAGMTEPGRKASLWLRDYWKYLSAARPDTSVQLVAHPWKQPSVVAQIRGTRYPDKYVIIGGHIDSHNYSQTTDFAPGADDNASGVATVSSIFKLVMEQKITFDYSIVFGAFSFEEGGLLGSAEIAAQFAGQNKEVMGFLQFDMVNYNKKDPGSIYINRDTHSSKTLNAFVDKLVSTYLQSTPKSFSCDYACSDHASWTAKNFLASFASESGLGDMMPLLHTTQDTHAQSNSRSDIAVNFGKLGLAFIMELGLE